MKTQFASSVREALDAKRNEASELWTDFAKARDEARESGIDFSDPKNAEALETLHSKQAAHSEAAEQARLLEAKMFEALEIDGADQPKADSDPDDAAGVIAKLVAGGLPTGGKKLSAGQRVVESEEWKEALSSGVFGTSSKVGQLFDPVKALDREEFKALLTGTSDTSAGAFTTAQRIAEYFPTLLRPIAVRNLVTVGDTDSDVVEWVKENSFTNAAAETAEATATGGASGTKPESAIDYAIVQSNVKTIAHWIPATKRALSDAGQLRTLVDQRLEDGVNLRLDSQMVNGDATGENLRGILNTSGIQTQSGAGMPRVEAVLRAITLLRLAFIEPTAILMNPTDAMEMRLEANASGDYYFGPPNLVGATQAWGIPIVQSAVLAAGTALVAKWDEAMLWVREGVTITATDSHSDFFVRNMVAILAEGRFAFGVPRPAAFATVTGV